jgi:hypothetical protein
MPPRPARLSLLIAVLVALVVPAASVAAAPGRGLRAPTHADTPREIHVDLAAQVHESRMAGVRAVSPATTGTPLPTTWCGTQTTSDDTQHSTLSAGQAFYKLVYAYASDQVDRFAMWQDVLQADVSLIGQYMALQDGATKSPRFDMGTSCGPDYADIQVVHLPGTRAYYADDFDAIVAAVGQELEPASAPRNVVILADGLTNDSAGSLYGLGQMWGGAAADVPDASNPYNDGDMYAALFPWDGFDPATDGAEFAPGFWPEGMLHEITHTLGAVSDAAPNSTLGGHCTDGSDVMCYRDNGSAGGSYSSTVCPELAGSQAGMTQTYDCNRDDYFNPDPGPDSYLYSHWNVFNSAFQAACATIGKACGSDGAASVPVSTGAPQVLGAAQAGSTLAADRGTWSGSPDGFAYQWQRTPLGGTTPVDVVGATGQTYALGASDVGRRVRVVVVASNASGDSPPARSELTSTVAAVASPPPATPVDTGPVTRPPAVQPPPVEDFRTVKVSLRRHRKVALKVTVTTRTTLSGMIATVVSRRVKVARRGTYRLTICAGPVCITKLFRARHGRAKLPAIVAASRRVGPVTLKLIGPGGRATGKLP